MQPGVGFLKQFEEKMNQCRPDGENNKPLTVNYNLNYTRLKANRGHRFMLAGNQKPVGKKAGMV